ncbi:hypothetical protein ACH4VM_18190 [Streptomyces sp. NPDC020792]|uniref:hypothetical protein n=1 Tax=Streptomyces sp. NPDC020792 TaxID=3365089 RepID=UPI00379118AE
MKLVVQVKLLPTPLQATALEATLRACNEAAAWASGSWRTGWTPGVSRTAARRART